jgi:hypothetical protein
MVVTFVDVSTYKVFTYGGPNGNSGVDATFSLGIPNGWAFLRFYPEARLIAKQLMLVESLSTM